MLEFVETLLDEVALFVDEFVVRDGQLSASVLRKLLS